MVPPRNDNDPLLELLRSHYGNQWNIVRTGHLWIATSVEAEADEPDQVLFEDDLDEFLQQMLNPSRAGNRSLLSAGWCADRLEQIGEGVYRAIG